ncbi:MAG: hypothetical protein N0E54_13270, partial [Candidatus Thiodiazotropha taylori]|nr:hypothetical protein [Candidatus Thiodiazotropha endolucinida]MCW4229705.1 hypothetical protein [Candidatus Thiodiazotropha taylori]
LAMPVEVSIDLEQAPSVSSLEGKRRYDTSDAGDCRASQDLAPVIQLPRKKIGREWTRITAKIRQ